MGAGAGGGAGGTPRTGGFEFRPIGVIRTPFGDHDVCPGQGRFRPEARGVVEVLPDYAQGLHDLEGFSHVILLYWFHRGGHGEAAAGLQRRPLLGGGPRGVFATRHYSRPNPIGLTVVRLLEVRGRTLEVGGIDVLDGTPLLDIKPYVPGFDHHEADRVGWLEGRLEGEDPFAGRAGG